jgi:hypothetical protein
MSRGKFVQNHRKEKFINSIPDTSIENSKLSKRCKFNFSFFDGSQPAGPNIADIPKADLDVLFEKLRLFSKEPLSYWQNARCGGGGLNIMEVYGNFPKKSDFQKPKHVPHDALWARFRFDNMTRLVGFVVPTDMDGKYDRNDGHRFDINTFYVVFYDPDHRFYMSENK